jgi:hypothetical protein
MEAKNMPKADFITSIVLMAFGGTVLVMSMRMPTFAEQGVNPYSAPGIVPGFLGGITGFLGLVLFVRSIIRKGYRLGVSGRTARAFFAAEMTRRFALTILVSVAYALGLLGHMPYEFATAIYVFAFVIIFEYKWKQSFTSQWKKVGLALLVALVAAFAVGAVFRYLFLVNLPGGEIAALGSGSHA